MTRTREDRWAHRVEWPLTVAAALASWLLDRVREVEQEGQVATQRDVAELAAEIRALRAELEGARTTT